MPISYDGGKYEFQELVNKIKKDKPNISSPGGYVKSIEERQKRGRQIAEILYNQLKGGASLRYTCEYCGLNSEGKPRYKAESVAELNEHLTGAHGAEPITSPNDYENNMKADWGNRNITKGAKEEEYDELENPKNTSKLKKNYRTNVKPYQKISKGDFDITYPYEESHPFDNLEPDKKLQVLREVNGYRYTPPYENPRYNDLDLVSRQGVDQHFNKERVAIMRAALIKLDSDSPSDGMIGNGSGGLGTKSPSFNGSPGATPNKTGADEEKDKEKTVKPSESNPFNFEGAILRKAIQEALIKYDKRLQKISVLSDLDMSEVKTKEKQPKGDPQNKGKDEFTLVTTSQGSKKQFPNSDPNVDFSTTTQ